MQFTLLKAKRHRACTTRAQVGCEGSGAIDANLLDAASIFAYPRIEIDTFTHTRSAIPVQAA